MVMEIKNKIKENLPFLLVGLTAVFWHITIKISVGDDLVYFRTLLDQGNSVWQILAHRYQTWSSRLAIEFVLLFIIRYTLLWRILDIIIFTTIPVMLCKITDTGERQKWWTAGLVLLYPFSDMVSAGWISTTTNYLWPLWCLLYLALLLKKMKNNCRLKWFQAVFGLLACIYASSQEQVAVILLVMLLTCMLYLWRRKIFRLSFLYAFTAIDIITLISILRCPGNAVRSAQEAAGRMPGFLEFTAADKIYLGLLNVEQVFIANANSIFFVTSAIFALLVCLKTKDAVKTFLSGIPFLTVFGYRFIRGSHVLYPKIFVIAKETVDIDWMQPETWFPLLFLAAAAAGLLYALYQLLKEDKEEYIYTILFLAVCFASGAVMGFSPTIYASGNRPYIYLYFGLIGVCIFCISREKERIRTGISAIVQRLGRMAVTLLCLTNILGVWWICYIMGKS